MEKLTSWAGILREEIKIDNFTKIWHFLLIFAMESNAEINVLDNTIIYLTTLY